ncbi:MAG: hypothetical protein O3B01_26085 [Planctomycetota bacterium]|nr:hypothetical protein [Planctomycetota bacterium]
MPRILRYPDFSLVNYGVPEQEIDQLVYAFYLPAPSLRQAGGLTPEEIQIVEGAAK